MSYETDPLLNIQFADIPSEVRVVLKDSCHQVMNAAIYSTVAVDLLVKTVKKPMIFLLTRLGILIVKVKNGIPARYIPFEAICEIVTNTETPRREVTSNPAYTPVILLSLVQSELSDIVFTVSDTAINGRAEISRFFNDMVTVLAANHDFPHIKIKSQDFLRLVDSEIDHRIPKSSRNGLPSFDLLPSKSEQKEIFLRWKSDSEKTISKFLTSNLSDDIDVEDLAEDAAALTEEVTGKKIKSLKPIKQPPIQNPRTDRKEIPLKMMEIRRSYPVCFTKVDSRDYYTGIPFATIQETYKEAFPKTIDITRGILFFDKVSVNVNGPSLVDTFLFFCAQRLYIGDGDKKIRFSARLSDISNVIGLESLKGMTQVENCSEGCVIMFREDMPDLFVGFRNPGCIDFFSGLLKMTMASISCNLRLDYCKTISETGAILAGNGSFLSPEPPLPSLKNLQLPLPPSEQAHEAIPLGEFIVSDELKAEDANLVKGWVNWAGRVKHYPDPYPSKKKHKDHTLNHPSIAYVSHSHFYLSQNGQAVRVIDTELIKRIDIQTLKNKHITDARRYRYILVCQKPEYDLCVEHDSEEEGRQCLAAILCACKATQGIELLPIESYDNVLKNKYNFEPPINYRVEVEDLPISDEYIRKLGTFRNQIARYFVMNDEDRVEESLDLAKNNNEDQSDFMKNLEAEYSVPFETNLNIWDYNGRLLRFFEKYAPENIPNIPLLLQKGSGVEEEMLYRLSKKYGPEPPIPDLIVDPMTKLLNKIFRLYDPKKLTLSRQIRDKNYGRERQLLEELRIAYGAKKGDPLFDVPELLESDKAAARPRLKRYMLRYMPDQITPANIDQILSENIPVEDIFGNLVSKYGSEPSVPSNRTFHRFCRFAQKYMPDQACDFDSVFDYFAAFNGSEEELFKLLIAKYGPEPLPEGAELFTNVQECVDLTKELPYVDVPENLYDRFPTMVNWPGAIYWFGQVSHWESPDPPIIRYAFVTASHLYVADSEMSVRRCIALKDIIAIYINTKRDLSEERTCNVLFQLTSFDDQHDLFLVFENDPEAKIMLWIIAEIMAKQNYRPEMCLIALANFDDVDSKCHPSPSFKLTVAPIPRRVVPENLAYNARSSISHDILGDPRKYRKLPTITTRGSGPSFSSKENQNLITSLDHKALKGITFGNSLPNHSAMHPRRYKPYNPAQDLTEMQDTYNKYNPVTNQSKHSIDGFYGTRGITAIMDHTMNPAKFSLSRRGKVESIQMDFDSFIEGSLENDTLLSLRDDISDDI